MSRLRRAWRYVWPEPPPPPGPHRARPYDPLERMVVRDERPGVRYSPLATSWGTSGGVEDAARALCRRHPKGVTVAMLAEHAECGEAKAAMAMRQAVRAGRFVRAIDRDTGEVRWMVRRA